MQKLISIAQFDLASQAEAVRRFLKATGIAACVSQKKNSSRPDYDRSTHLKVLSSDEECAREILELNPNIGFDSIDWNSIEEDSQDTLPLV